MTKTVRIGQEVRLDPYKERENGKQEDPVIVTGTVAYINEPHRWFGVVYGPGLRTSFFISQVGEDVVLCR